MRTSQYFFPTLKETPSDAEVVSHQLMLRAGMIRRVAAGVYNWLPLGLKVLKNVEAIVREEMDRAGALEVLMPTVQPAELWQDSGRWNDYGPELLRMKDRHNRDFCLGPTHEEVITTMVKNDVQSYKELPLNLYQIQTKFRDEIRPRFGLMRGREFTMKDAYSFDIDEDSMQVVYDKMFEAYHNIFKRLDLEFCCVEADNGSIGGNSSHEFHVLASSGEDNIAFCKELDFAANVEMIALSPIDKTRSEPTESMTKVETPNVHTIDELSTFCKVDASKTIKTIIVQGEESPIALLVRGDHKLNEVKAEKIPGVVVPLAFADTPTVVKHTETEPGSVGPIGLSIPVYADHSVMVMSDFVCGANESDQHYTGANWERDTALPLPFDLREAQDGDLCPIGSRGETISIAKGIEVGHIFQLGQKYSKAMDAHCLDSNGKKVHYHMGCYGVGVSRVVAAAIEQNHDENGIIWPESIAPFQVAIVTIGYQKSELVKETADKLYNELIEQGYDVLLDDRKERPGIMFKDMELIGIPHQFVVGEKTLADNKLEYKNRRQGSKELIDACDVLKTLTPTS